MRILVCGGRHYTDQRAVFELLNCLRPTLVIEGGATGADRLARAWAIANEAPHMGFPADWKAHGKKAGPRRNQEMIDIGKPDFWLAFPGGKGTADMVRRLKAAGIPGEEILE